MYAIMGGTFLLLHKLLFPLETELHSIPWKYRSRNYNVRRQEQMCVGMTLQWPGPPNSLWTLGKLYSTYRTAEVLENVLF
jgi:hypothetical protein